MDLRERFLKTYANIPLTLRKEIILVMDDEPITWSVAYVEILNNTGKSGVILRRLKEMGII